MILEIPLTSKTWPGKLATIDADDADLVTGYTWYVHRSHKTFYAITTINGKTVYMHRLLMGAGPGQQIDHEDRNGLNNRRSTNLRIATRPEQGANKGAPCTNTSGYKGVSWDKKRAVWQTGIKVHGKRRNLGLYGDPVEAARVYDAAARELHGSFACVNFPDETWNVGIRPPRVLASNNTSGYRGVTWDKMTRRWIAASNAGGKHKNLGRFNDPTAAARAYDDYARQYHGEDAVLNFPG